jgi:YidC/Oxa1 family membrane protein insertase
MFAAFTDLFVSLADTLAPVGGMVTAIVVVTIAVRTLLHPLTRLAVRGERARAALAPRLAELRQRYAGNPTRIAEETLALHRAEGVSPFAGLWPVLAQAPVLLVLYQVFAHEGGPDQLWLFLVLMAGLTLVAWLTSRRTARLISTPSALAKVSRALPYATVAIAAFLPTALVVYLLTSTTWTLVENTVLRRGLL